MCVLDLCNTPRCTPLCVLDLLHTDAQRFILYIESFVCVICALCVQVSSKVHNQLLKIADERAQAAEQKALQLERQVKHLHSVLVFFDLTTAAANST